MQGQHGVGVSEIVHPGVWGANLSGKLFEVVVDSLGMQMSPKGGGKYQGRLALLLIFPPLPLPAGLQPVHRLGLLSTAELIKCAEAGAQDISTDEKLMDALYNDDFTTSDNIADMMLTAKSREDVTMGIANLYLQKQIIFERI